MEKKIIGILISTYNGEKWIEEQLNSLTNQTYKDIKIYIRDDGSNDKTVNIIEKYINKHDNIKLIKGSNVGLVNSFYKCLEEAFVDVDYFAYCDQDDSWHKDKLERAIKHITNSESQKPLVYFSELNYCDHNLNYINVSKKNKIGASFRNSLVDCITSGNTMVFNKKMAELMLKSHTKDIYFHDWWMYMIASSIGEIIYDSKPTIEYRRTKNNVSPSGKRTNKAYFI